MKPFTGLKAIYKGVFNSLEKQQIYKIFVQKNAMIISSNSTPNFQKNFFVVYLKTPFALAHKLKYAFIEENLRFELFFDSRAERLMPNVLIIVPQKTATTRNLYQIRAEVEHNQGKFLELNKDGNPVFVFETFIEAAVADHYMSKRFMVYFASKLQYFKIHENKKVHWENMVDDKSFYDGDTSVLIKCDSGGEGGPLEPEKVKVTYSASFDYSMAMFPERKLVLPRPPREEPSMKDLKERMKDLKIERKVKLRAEIWSYFASE